MAASHESFAGHDPFDGLNSQLFEKFPFLKQGLFGLAWTQLFKRSAVNLRTICNVPARRNPKGVALFILGLLEDFRRTNEQHYLEQALELGDWLIRQQCDKKAWQYSCWGYHFDWNARAFFVEKGKPNIITTIYVAQSLYRLWQATGNNKYLEPAADAANFIVNKLYIAEDGCHYFAYIPGEKAFVHNASLWGAAWVSNIAKITEDKEYAELALKVARQSVRDQRNDGAWVYGALPHHQFVDGFHTGYNLEALHIIRSSLATNEFDAAIHKGLEYYKKSLLEKDGTAKYYNNNKYPLDMHSVAQAVLTLLKLGDKEDLSLAGRVIKRSVETMYMPEKQRFAYQKHKFFTNKINYIRWTQAWVYYSLAYYNRLASQGAD